MTFLTELHGCVGRLSAHPELDVDVAELLNSVRSAGGEGAAAVLAEASAVHHILERLMAVSSAVIAELSTGEARHGGFAAKKGFRSPESFVQSITGDTRAGAVRSVRLGQSLLEGAAGGSADSGDAGGDEVECAESRAWHEVLGQAMLHGTITAKEHDAILRGLGQPPTDASGMVGVAAVEVWAIAAEQLLREASDISVEELAQRARAVRDVLDPVGAENRFERRFAKRSFRMWVDSDGVSQAHIIFDDEMAAWVRALIDAALRARRGGPRFVDAGEVAQAEALTKDPRTNDQITYDLVIDVLRAGAQADASSVFGSRQPGVRMVIIKDAIGPRDAFGRLLTTGHIEDGGQPLPGTIIDRNACASGYRAVTLDTCGNPLDVGREKRLFTTKQRIGLAICDGGCLWPECSMPASYCEAHHADHWEDGGATDVDRGLLLCRFHHMALHHHGWRVTRAGLGPFILHPPPGLGVGDPIELRSKATWQWAWDPPPPPERRNWRAA